MDERLKEIKEVHEQYLRGRGSELDNDDIKWLIEQAEKTEKLKEDNKKLNRLIEHYAGVW